MLQRAKDAPKRWAEHEAARAARIAPAAKLLGMTADAIRDKLRDGTSLAKLAESKGVSRAKLLDALKEGITAASKLEGVTFTPERLTEMAERMADQTGQGRGGHRGPGGHGGFGPGGFGPGGHRSSRPSAPDTQGPHPKWRIPISRREPPLVTLRVQPGHHEAQ